MPFQLADAVVELHAPGGRLAADLSSAEQRLKQTEHAMDHVKHKGHSMFAEMLKFELLKEAGSKIKEMMTSFEKAEEDELRLGAAFRATGQDVEANMKVVEELNEIMERGGNITKEQTMAAEQYAVSMGNTGEQLHDVMMTALGLSKVMGTDLRGATEAVVKAQQGHWRELQRALPALKNANTEEERKAALLKIATVGLEQQKAAMGGYGQESKALSIAVENFGRSVGENFDKLIGHGGKLTHVFRMLTSSTPEWNAWTTGLAKDLQLLELYFTETEQSVLELIDTMTGSHLNNKEMDISVQRAKSAYDVLAAEYDKLNKAVENQAGAEKKLNADKIASIGKVKEKTADAFMKIEDIWKDAQTRANADHDHVIKQIEEEIAARKKLKANIAEKGRGSNESGGGGAGGGEGGDEEGGFAPLPSADKPVNNTPKNGKGKSGGGKGGGGKEDDGFDTTPSQALHQSRRPSKEKPGEGDVEADGPSVPGRSSAKTDTVVSPSADNDRRIKKEYIEKSHRDLKAASDHLDDWSPAEYSDYARQQQSIKGQADAYKSYHRNQEIAEFGSTTRADVERRLAADKAATVARLKREAASGKYDAKDETTFSEYAHRELQKTADRGAAYEKKRLPEENAERARIGLTPAQPIHTQGMHDAKILEALNKIVDQTVSVGGLAPG